LKAYASALIHLYLNPSGAGGASREDGGTHTLGLSDFDRVWFAREVFLFSFSILRSFRVF
jgi:hypothetical protein